MFVCEDLTSEERLEQIAALLLKGVRLLKSRSTKSESMEDKQPSAESKMTHSAEDVSKRHRPEREIASDLSKAAQ